MAIVVPLIYSPTLGHPSRIQPGDTIDPTFLPASTSGSSTPTLIAQTDTFLVAADTQLLVALPIKVDGRLSIEGTMVVL